MQEMSYIFFERIIAICGNLLRQEKARHNALTSFVDEFAKYGVERQSSPFFGRPWQLGVAHYVLQLIKFEHGTPAPGANGKTLTNVIRKGNSVVIAFTGLLRPGHIETALFHLV